MPVALSVTWCFKRLDTAGLVTREAGGAVAVNTLTVVPIVVQLHW